MELVDKAITINDFGIRKMFPWTGSAQGAPWTKVVTDRKEISFVKELLSPRFSFGEPFIRRVENPYLWARYVLAYEELGANDPHGVTERHVIHATSDRNALKIAEENFDWRRVSRARFGRGVSFAARAAYAQKYASVEDAYIVAGIPVAETSFGSYNTKIPGPLSDTTVDFSGNVYVKYYDNDFYPYYIAQ